MYTRPGEERVWVPGRCAPLNACFVPAMSEDHCVPLCMPIEESGFGRWNDRPDMSGGAVRGLPHAHADHQVISSDLAERVAHPADAVFERRWSLRHRITRPITSTRRRTKKPWPIPMVEISMKKNSILPRKHPR